MIGQLPPAPRRTKSSPEPQAMVATPRREIKAMALLEAELATVQGRLHDALEVLEGVLAERSALLKQTHELRSQLAEALALQHGGHTGADSSPVVPEAGEEEQAGAPARVLRQELLLAQARLDELRRAQQAWQAERAALLSDVEEERVRLQEGLAQALTQASYAQREADVAAERAAHWCSLADVLQKSALLPEGAASPSGSGAASGSATPASRMASTPASAASTSVLSSSSALRSVGSMRGPETSRSAARLLGDWRPTSAARHGPSRPAAGSRYASASGGGSPQGPGLLKAFHAVAEAPCSREVLASAAVGQTAGAGPSAVPPAAAADAATAKLRLKRLDSSPPGARSPLTPLPHVALPGAAATTPAMAASSSSTRSTGMGKSAAHKPRSAGLLGRLASLTACGAGLAAERIK